MVVDQAPKGVRGVHGPLHMRGAPLALGQNHNCPALTKLKVSFACDCDYVTNLSWPISSFELKVCLLLQNGMSGGVVKQSNFSFVGMCATLNHVDFGV
jgi:hypothetical protein